MGLASVLYPTTCFLILISYGFPWSFHERMGMHNYQGGGMGILYLVTAFMFYYVLIYCFLSSLVLHHGGPTGAKQVTLFIDLRSNLSYHSPYCFCTFD